LPGGVIAWSVTDYELITRLLTDSRVSRDAYRHWPAWQNGESELAKTWSLAVWVQDRNMITAYGTEHARLRKLVSKAFTARRTTAMRPRIEQITGELLDALASSDPRLPVDLREQFAYPLPTRVISDLLGVPEDMRGGLLAMMHAIFRTDATEEEAAANLEALYGVATEFIAAKRAQPADDLASALIAVRDEGGAGLSEIELIDTLFLLYTAGHETTVNLLDQATFLLLSNPSQLRLVREGAAAWEDVIEETLRVESPVSSLPLRFAVEDIELPDVTIKAGDPILINFGAAGRDQRVHGANADEFLVGRETRRDHLSFGYGVHFCVGASLARLEAAVALPALFGRFPDLSLAEPAEQIGPLGSFVSNGHAQLPVLLGVPVGV
jgi:cytochrome P450